MKIRNGFVSNSSSSSFSVIGLMVDKGKLKKEVIARNCKCEVENIESMAFCPECGDNVMKKSWEWIDGVDDDGIGKFSFEDDYESEELIIYIPSTYASSSDYDVEMTELPDNIYKMKDELKEIAEGLGIWDESKFGIWGGQRYG